MSALLIAVFRDFAAAAQTRVELVREGFPTDRVDLTAACEPGRAAVEPADSLHGKLTQYFRSLLANEDEQPLVERLAERVEAGEAAVVVHPRGSIETLQAARTLADAGSVEIVEHDLAGQEWEHAAAPGEKPWIDHFVAHGSSKADCIYCRLFEADSD